MIFQTFITFYFIYEMDKLFFNYVDDLTTGPWGPILQQNIFLHKQMKFRYYLIF